MRELLSNNSLFVGQLYERARDLIFFTIGLQTVNYYSTTLLELIYFLNTVQVNILIDLFVLMFCQYLWFLLNTKTLFLYIVPYITKNHSCNMHFPTVTHAYQVCMRAARHFV